MTIREYSGLYDDLLADDPFDGKLPAVNLRVGSFDDHSFFSLSSHHIPAFPLFDVADVYSPSGSRTAYALLICR
jgi:hypothetical protein